MPATEGLDGLKISRNGGTMSKSTAMKILGIVALVAGAAASAATAGLVPALIAGGTALLTGVAGWNHPSPQAVAAFGTSAK